MQINVICASWSFNGPHSVRRVKNIYFSLCYTTFPIIFHFIITIAVIIINLFITPLHNASHRNEITRKRKSLAHTHTWIENLFIFQWEMKWNEDAQGWAISRLALHITPLSQRINMYLQKKSALSSIYRSCLMDMIARRIRWLVKSN